MNRVEKTILTIPGGAHLSVHALMLALPSLIPILMSEFNIGLDILGLIVTIIITIIIIITIFTMIIITITAIIKLLNAEVIFCGI